ncbi:uncharacterized protein LOC131167801 [Malania oleifera]|uniref:uncharacterized protein LOC131167801 n=1 Tax=Malania oleifera TaxID=397392 RepID=UPI0025AE6BBD|nr:uncharacterized protein LOC131167801 [Malania oleifera]
MMGGWRRPKDEYNHLEVQKTRSNSRKPPLSHWQATVPSWEKKFCYSVGAVPWRKVLETKKLMYLYENVVKWNDSAGEEAFHNAKNRFWAEMNGLSCDISLPDPDIYIDVIDWNCDIDPELLLDLEREPAIPVKGDNDEDVVILGHPLLLNHSFSCTGWGDAEDDLRKVTNSSGNEIGDCQANACDDENPWESGFAQRNEAENGWGNCWNNSMGLNTWENNLHASENFEVRRDDGDWNMWNGNGRKTEGTGWYRSRYKTLKSFGDENQADCGEKNGRWRKRVNFAYERPSMERKPGSRQGNSMNSCGRGSHRRSRNTRNSWDWEKQCS